MSSLQLGIDIGGTFTDLIVFDPSSGELDSYKAFTTDPNFERGIANALRQPAFDGEDVGAITHGTTVAINAVVERSGVKVGLLHTDGFRDLMDMGRGVRPVEAGVDPYYQRPHEKHPVVPRYLRRPVNERVLEDGTVFFDLEDNLDELEEQVDTLVSEGVEAVAVCLMHSYKYPRHEQRVRQVLEQRHPDLPCYISSDICPYPREYDRTSTTVLNAYTAPIMDNYLDRFRGALGEFVNVDRTPVWYMSNSGGMTTFSEVKRRPVLTFECGPVAGALATRDLGSLVDEENLLGFDMGGTTCDVSTVTDGELVVSRELEVEFDLISALPTVDIRSVGSGGGSIAALDPAGGLSVGPESAGSDPGPACYGRGGTEPTLTDAFARLGYLTPEIPLGGEVAVDLDRAEDALETTADPLGVSPDRMAEMIYRVACSDMAEAVRELTVYRGIDPQDFSLVAFGAAGPLVATSVAEEVDITRVLVPRYAGVFSAFGLVGADIQFEEVEPIQQYLDELNPEMLRSTFDRLERECVGVLRDQGVDRDDVRIEYSFDGWYEGQSWDLRARLGSPGGDGLLDRMTHRFHERHEALRGFRMESTSIRCLQVRVVGYASRTTTPFVRSEPADGEPTPIHTRGIQVRSESRNVPCYRADALRPSHRLEGPCIIHADNYTLKVNPGNVCTVDPWGTFEIEV